MTEICVTHDSTWCDLFSLLHFTVFYSLSRADHQQTAVQSSWKQPQCCGGVQTPATAGVLAAAQHGWEEEHFIHAHWLYLKMYIAAMFTDQMLVKILHRDPTRELHAFTCFWVTWLCCKYFTVIYIHNTLILCTVFRWMYICNIQLNDVHLFRFSWWKINVFYENYDTFLSNIENKNKERNLSNVCVAVYTRTFSQVCSC